MEITIYDPEQLESLAEELGLQHPDYERLEIYISLVRSYPLADKGEDYYRDNLAKWISDEQESYYGEHDSDADFARYLIEGFSEFACPNWVVIDYAETWRRNLRHDYTEDRGHYWADIY